MLLYKEVNEVTGPPDLLWIIIIIMICVLHVVIMEENSTCISYHSY